MVIKAIEAELNRLRRREKLQKKLDWNEVSRATDEVREVADPSIPYAVYLFSATTGVPLDALRSDEDDDHDAMTIYVRYDDIGATIPVYIPDLDRGLTEVALTSLRGLIDGLEAVHRREATAEAIRTSPRTAPIYLPDEEVGF